MDDLLASQASQSTKLQERLNLEKRNESCADIHSQVTNNVENIPSASSINHQRQQVQRTEIGKEELVKYMSNLPSYLEKGGNPKEKALNVGVLDWRRLEKWKYNHKLISYQSSRYSPSTSNSNSSVFSTDKSPTRSSGGQSSSPSLQRMHRPTLQSHLNASPDEVYSQGIKPVVENPVKFHDLKATPANPVKGQQSIFRMYQSLSRNQSEINLKETKRKDTDPVETSSDSKSYDAASRSKGKTKIQDGGLEESRDPCCDLRNKYHERCKTVVLPRDDPESSNSAMSCPCDLERVNNRRSMEASRRSISEGSFPLHNAYPYSDLPHSCPLPIENENFRDSKDKITKLFEWKESQDFVNTAQPSPCSLKMSISPSRGKIREKKTNIMARNPVAVKSCEGSDVKNTIEGPKSRNPSPTHRFLNGLGRIGRASSSKDSSEHVTAKCGSDKAAASSCLEDSSNEKPNGTRRSQSSPLRRLLDPLLKPKAAKVDPIANPSEKDSTVGDKVCKSSNGHVESSSVHSVKVKLDLRNCKTINVDDSHHKKHGSSTVQALLQIVIKNGLPLFTFAVDNNSNILAATMRKSSASRKNENCWIYTFFSVLELKKKNGWINQGGKGKGHGYVPNAIAQMMVSDTQFSDMVRHDCLDEVSIREFVLFALDLKQADQNASNLQKNDELAAIIVKVPKDEKRDYLHNPSVIGLGQCRESEENGSCDRSKDLFSTTVILPSGVHGLPRKGEPSPLIERWISGGVCDCGGWDMGCRLRVLANQPKQGRRSSSAKPDNGADRFELFSQGEVIEDTPLFSLCPFKDGIFSIEFNSSFSFLQAFAICIAILNSRKPYKLSELSKLFEDKSSEENAAFVVSDGIKAPDQVQPEVPASYASYPPLSPIGRV